MGEGIFSSSLVPCSSCWLLLLLFYRIVVVGAEREVAGAGEACSSTAEAIHIEIEIEGGGGACIPLGRKSEDLLGKYLVGSGEEMELWKKGERGRANQVMRQPS